MGMTVSLFNLGLTTDIFAESPTPLADTYLIEYEINTAGYTGDPSDYVKAVSLHVSTGTDLVQLTSAPGGTAGWLPIVPGGINNSGCDSAARAIACKRLPRVLCSTAGVHVAVCY